MESALQNSTKIDSTILGHPGEETELSLGLPGDEQIKQELFLGHPGEETESSLGLPGDGSNPVIGLFYEVV